MTQVTAAQVAAVRGGPVGLMLGDAVGATGGQLTAHGLLEATPTGQVACFTVEGAIRASVRYSHRGICHPPSVVWHAYRRWAAGQGMADTPPVSGLVWPDGWLAEVPALRALRGAAPAVVPVLRGPSMDTADTPTATSLEADALVCGLPVGLSLTGRPGAFAREVAALTHAAPAADAAAVGACLLAHLIDGHPWREAANRTLDDCANLVPVSTTMILKEALARADSDPANANILRRLAPDRHATSALAGATYVAASFTGPDRIREAVLFAAAAGEHVAATAGAILGAANGVYALPVDLVARLELVWVADTLAHDLIHEAVDSPSGSEYAPAADPTWWNRYPGW